MLTGIAITVVEQLNGKDLYELKVENNDDTDDDEQKIENEKDYYPIYNSVLPELKHFTLLDNSKKIFNESGNPISQLFRFLPELPPES